MLQQAIAQPNISGYQIEQAPFYNPNKSIRAIWFKNKTIFW